jgi:Na+/H+ antiporter NhaD/arsenite permease-like protein
MPDVRTTVALVFALVYLGMFLGRFPRLRLDRTGIALLGALVLLVTRAVSLEGAAAAIDLPTIALLFGLMVLSAQLRLGGFYSRVTGRLADLPHSPRALLAVLIALVGALSAVFTNDVVCLAVTPVVVTGCRRRGLDPVPFLLAVACASNVGSAATLIGNPQNMLIGQALALSFGGYLALALGPAVLGLALTWAWIAYRGGTGRPATPEEQDPDPQADRVPFDRWQTTKGLGLAAALLLIFLVAPWPRELVALAGAGVLLTSRRLHSRDMLGLVDWQLLVLFAGLFVVNGALADTGLVRAALDRAAAAGVHLERPAWLFGATVVLSNAVSNVPAVMLLLPAATHPLAGPVLALASTLAGNLVIVGSIANIIVVEAAARHGVRISWAAHARVGIPVTLLTLLAAGLALVVASATA